MDYLVLLLLYSLVSLQFIRKTDQHNDEIVKEREDSGKWKQNKLSLPLSIKQAFSLYSCLKIWPGSKEKESERGREAKGEMKDIFGVISNKITWW